MLSRTHQKSLGTSSEGASPGNYALGSQQSRAAARALLEHRFASREKLTIILSAIDGRTEPRIGEWREGTDGKLFRLCYLPAGMELEEAERIVSQPEWKATAQPLKPERVRPLLKPEW